MFLSMGSFACGKSECTVPHPPTFFKEKSKCLYRTKEAATDSMLIL
jgi:hypothetical protein